MSSWQGYNRPGQPPRAPQKCRSSTGTFRGRIRRRARLLARRPSGLQKQPSCQTVPASRALDKREVFRRRTEDTRDAALHQGLECGRGIRQQPSMMLPMCQIFEYYLDRISSSTTAYSPMRRPSTPAPSTATGRLSNPCGGVQVGARDPIVQAIFYIPRCFEL